MHCDCAYVSAPLGTLWPPAARSRSTPRPGRSRARPRPLVSSSRGRATRCRCESVKDGGSASSGTNCQPASAGATWRLAVAGWQSRADPSRTRLRAHTRQGRWWGGGARAGVFSSVCGGGVDNERALPLGCTRTGEQPLMQRCVVGDSSTRTHPEGALGLVQRRVPGRHKFRRADL